MLCDLSLVWGNVTGKSKNEGEKNQQKVIQSKQELNLKFMYLVHHCATSVLKWCVWSTASTSRASNLSNKVVNKS